MMPELGLALCLAVVAALPSQSPQTGPAPASARDSQVRQLMDAWTRSWNSYDLAEIDRVFLADGSVTYFSSEKAALIRGIDALRAHHAGFGFVAGGKVQANKLWLEEIRVDWRSDVAVVLATWLFQRPGGSPPQRGSVTFVVVPTPDGYRIAHGHFANAPAAKQP